MDTLKQVQDPKYDEDVVNKRYLTNVLNSLIADNTDDFPIGSIVSYPSSTIPSNWLLLDGTDFDELVYPELFTLLGTHTLPNLKGRTIVGKDPSDTDFDTIGELIGSKLLQSHTHKIDPPSTTSSAQSADHDHNVGWDKDGGSGTSRYTVHSTGSSGAGGQAPTSGASVGHTHTVNIAEFDSGSAGTGTAGNIQPSIVENYIIKAKSSNGGLIKQGAPGMPGKPGIGMPIGGTTGQILAKLDELDYHYTWIDAVGSGDMLKSVYDTNNDGSVNKADLIKGLDTAGNSKLYGTNASGVVGFYDIPTGAVASVNGETGAVTLTQDDIGDGTTYKQYSLTEKTKLAGIATGAEVNVNADWNSTSGDSQILNKPTIPTVITDHTALSNIGTNTHATIDTKIAFYDSNIELVKEPTGFTNNDTIGVAYNSTTRKVTLTGTFAAYYKGVLISALTNGWESAAHATTLDVTYFLYYDGSNFQFSTTPWTFDQLQIATVQYGTNNKIALKETHGFMPWQDHQGFHNTIGTYRTSGGTLSSYTLASTTVANRRPDISATVIQDEDLKHTINALTSKTYTQKYLAGSGATRTFVTGASDIIPLNGNVPYYNLNTGGTWSQEPMTNNNYATIWVTAIPVTSDAGSQAYRYIFTQPQSQGSLDVQRNLTPSDINIGDSASLVAEFVFLAKIIIQMSGNNWTITEVVNLTGNRYNQTGSPSGNYLSIVNHDATLTGSGTSLDPLIVANPCTGTNTGDQDLSGLALKTNVLELNNTTSFTPDTDYEPATKKYVDDNVYSLPTASTTVLGGVKIDGTTVTIDGNGVISSAGGTSTSVMYITSSDGSDTYTATTPSYTAYAVGDMFALKVTTANTTACTLNVNSLGAKSIVRGTSTALLTGDITANKIVYLVYDGTSFQLQSQGVDAVSLSGTQTLTNKTLTAPKFASAGYIADNNGNEQIKFVTTTSAVNDITVQNAATANAPQIQATGGDTNIDLKVVPKGTGKFTVDGNTALYTQTNVRNASAANTSSSDVVATADNGTDSTNYVDLGINSSTYADAAYNITGADDSYLYSNGGNLAIGTQTAAKTLKLFTGGTTSDKLRATVSDTGLVVVGTVAGSNLSGTNTGDVAKATGSDIITGTDDTKYVTSKAIEDSYLIESSTNTVTDIITCTTAEYNALTTGQRAGRMFAITDGVTSSNYNTSGWNFVTGVYASATTITVATGAAGIYSIGDKLMLTQTTVKYFYIVGVTDTVLTITGGSDYTLANATITEMYYSKISNPLLFPQWFKLTNPTLDVSVFDNGSAGQPTISETRFSINGRTVTVHFRATGYKAGTNPTVLSFADTFLPLINRTNNSGRTSCGVLYILTGGTHYIGNVRHESNNNFYGGVASNLTDNALLDDVSFTITYEI